MPPSSADPQQTLILELVKRLLKTRRLSPPAQLLNKNEFLVPDPTKWYAEDMSVPPDSHLLSRKLISDRPQDPPLPLRQTLSHFVFTSGAPSDRRSQFYPVINKLPVPRSQSPFGKGVKDLPAYALLWWNTSGTAVRGWSSSCPRNNCNAKFALNR